MYCGALLIIKLTPKPARPLEAMASRRDAS